MNDSVKQINETDFGFGLVAAATGSLFAAAINKSASENSTVTFSESKVVAIPEKIKSKLNLPDKDKGIDGIVITPAKEYYAVQVKYRKNKKPIPFGELATFPALAFFTFLINNY